MQIAHNIPKIWQILKHYIEHAMNHKKLMKLCFNNILEKDTLLMDIDVKKKNHLWVCWYARITGDPVTVSEKWLNNGDLLTEYNLFNCLDVTI